VPTGVGLLAAPVVLARRPADHVAQALPGALVEQCEELVDVDGRRRVLRLDDSAVGDLGRARGGEREVHVAPGGARLRGLADRRRGAPAQRGHRFVEVHEHLGLAVVGQLDALDHPDLASRALHEVALDELAGAQEAALDAVGVAAGEQHEEHAEGRERDGARRDPTRDACLPVGFLDPFLHPPAFPCTGWNEEAPETWRWQAWV
jgi:hypothetical protein